MPQFNYMNLPATFQAAEAVKGARMGNELMREQLDTRKRVKQLTPGAMAGDPNALNQLAGVDIGAATNVQSFLTGRTEAEQATIKRNLNTMAALVLSVERAPENERPQAYQRALESAQAMGLDVSKAPPQYDPTFTRAIAMQVMDVKKALEPVKLGEGDVLRDPFGTIAKGAPSTKAPTIKEFYDKATGRKYKAQWNPATQAWDRIGGMKAPTEEDGGLTLSQQRTNEKIDNARKVLADAGMSHEEILRVAKSQKDTGRSNPDYNPYINSMVRLAVDRKYGADSEFEQTFKSILTPPPEPPAPPPPAPPPPPVSDVLPPGSAEATPGPAGAPAPLPAGAPAPTTAAQSPIATLSLDQIDALLNGPDAANLTPEQVIELDNRLKALGF